MVRPGNGSRRSALGQGQAGGADQHAGCAEQSAEAQAFGENAGAGINADQHRQLAQRGDIAQRGAGQGDQDQGIGQGGEEADQHDGTPLGMPFRDQQIVPAQGLRQQQSLQSLGTVWMFLSPYISLEAF